MGTEECLRACVERMQMGVERCRKDMEGARPKIGG